MDMKIQFKVKSGTGGYFDYEACDLLLATVSMAVVPRVHEKIEIIEDNDAGRKNASGQVLQEPHEYLVTDVIYCLGDGYGEGRAVKVYVVPIGRSIQTVK